MKQIFQNLRGGQIQVLEQPAPQPGRNEVLIRTTRSLVSAGTERMLANFGKAGWIGKARQQPEKLQQVIDKIKTDGLAPTLRVVFSKLDKPLPLGYCQVGEVLAVGSGVRSLAPGDRVASNGSHAELVCVAENLCAKIPDTVSDDQAVFTVLGAVALQGIRLLEAQLGERVAVIGLGLIGLLSVQILRAAGLRVIGFDLDDSKVELGRRFGAEAYNVKEQDPVKAALAFSADQGVDGVLVTAATESSEPLWQAPQMCRKRGRVVLVGVSGLELRRSDFYEKELSFQVSCSYGPGRYDPLYEQQNIDYPIGFVRWTARRNFEAVLALMQEGRLDPLPLLSRRLPFAAAAAYYDQVLADNSGLGTIFEYAAKVDVRATIELDFRPQRREPKVILGFIGAGEQARSALLPAFSRTPALLRGICSKSGAAAADLARKYRLAFSSSDYQEILRDPQINAVVISTRHDSHAELVCAALKAGKHVFVEKPLCLTAAEYDRIHAVHQERRDLVLMVGFNRRYAPHTQKILELLRERREPLAMLMVVNAGAVAANHWVHDPQQGGGRIVGEACHFEDLLQYLAGAELTDRQINSMAAPAGFNFEDRASIALKFSDGSIGTVHYFANGPRQYPKERLLVFSEGRTLELDNFITLRGYGFKGFTKFRLLKQDKGHQAAAAAFIQQCC